MLRCGLIRPSLGLLLTLILLACSDAGPDANDPGTVLPLDGALPDASGPDAWWDGAAPPDLSLRSDASTQAPLDGSSGPERDGGLDGATDGSAEVTDGSVEGASDAGSELVKYGARLLSQPPGHMATKGSNAACTQSFRTVGYEPDGPASERHPLFLYFVGTAASAADLGARFDAEAAHQVTRSMAQRGFVSLSVEYDNELFSFFTNKGPCLFGKDNAQSLLARACALPNVDCTRGIATWGHSQGALLAHTAANYEPRVRAVWTTGYSGISDAMLPYTRFRVVNGEADTMNAAVSVANKTAGFSAADQCPDDGRDSCLRAEGSGWIVVRKSASKLNSADHCWFNKRSCIESGESLEPNWLDAAAGAPFALSANADWVARTVARP